MPNIFDVRHFDESECLAAIAVYEGEIARGNTTYHNGIKTLNARIAEIHGENVRWSD